MAVKSERYICAICDQILTEDFPDDFPEEFKFCCSCLAWAISIVGEIDEEWLKRALSASPTVRKMYGRMTVYNDKRKK